MLEKIIGWPLNGGKKPYSCFDKGCPTKPYATMPIGIMGKKSLALID